jgi:hemoglobin
MRIGQLCGWTMVGWMVLMTGCAMEQAGTGKAMGGSLYERLGKKEAITAVVDDFVNRVANDNRINGKFANANIPRLKKMLVDQICEASGGPCTYTGKDMKATHVGMGITNADFDALVQDLVASLNKFKVGEREKTELLNVLGPMRKDIVTAT